MRCRVLVMLLSLTSFVGGVPSAAGNEASSPLQIVIERIDNTGSGEFRLDLTLDPGKAEGFMGAVKMGLDRSGRPLLVQPLTMTSFNEHREPTVYAGDEAVSTCSAGICEVGRSAAAGMTVLASDDGPSDTPVVVIAVLAQNAEWTFTGSNYRLRTVPARFRYVTGDASSSAGVDYLGTGAEAFLGEAVATSRARASVAVASGPCSTSGSAAVSRGVGQVILEGGSERLQETCPTDDGVLAQVARKSTTWRVAGPAAGDQEFRGARLLVVDLPLS